MSSSKPTRISLVPLLPERDTFKIEETADRLVIATLIKGDKLSESPSCAFNPATIQWYHLDPSIDSNESTISKLSMGSAYHPTSYAMGSSPAELGKNIGSSMLADKKKDIISPSAKIAIRKSYFPLLFRQLQLQQ